MHRLNNEIYALKTKNFPAFDIDEQVPPSMYDNTGICLDTHSRKSLAQCAQMDTFLFTRNDEIYCYNIITNHFREDIARLLSNVKADICKTNSIEKTNQLSMELFRKPIFLNK